MKKYTPIVAIVGRPNVGKSTLFNQIGKQRVSIVDDIPGVTRDRIYLEANWLNYHFLMVDTGGISFTFKDEKEDIFLRSIRQQAKIATEEADVIVFVVDGRTGVTQEDEDVAKFLRNTNKNQRKTPIILAVNKIDSEKQEQDIYEFYSLGLGDPIPIAASNARNLGDLLDEIVKYFPKESETEEIDEEKNFLDASEPETETIIEPMDNDEICIAVIGRPNVGKSSLVNALLGESRVIVSDVAGTTRDAIDVHFQKDNVNFTLIDTAGMRRKSKIDEPIERYSVLRALRAVDRADVVLMVIDATEGITEQDTKIAGYAHEAGKGTILVVNKWDIFENKDEKSTLRFTEDLREKLGFLQYAPVLYTSAVTKQRVHRLTDLIKYVADQQSMRVQTSVLNELLRDAMAINPPPSFKGRSLKILFMTQAGIRPPKFIFFVNDPELFHFSYQRFLENKLRETFGFEGTPIKFTIRSRKDNEEEI